MNKAQANDILDRIRAGQTLSLAITNAALQALGDLPRLRAPERPLSQTLCVDGHESRVDWSCAVDGQTLGERDTRIGWSRYLDSRENKGVTQ